MTKKIVKKCLTCNKKFSGYKDRIYCCKNCYWKNKIGILRAKREIVRCVTCNKKFKRIISHNTQYCSIECYKIRWKNKNYRDKLSKAISEGVKRWYKSNPKMKKKCFKIEKKCLNCTQKMYITKKSNRKFCNAKCYHEYQSNIFKLKFPREKRLCIICNKVFITRVDSNQKCCSNKCGYTLAHLNTDYKKISKKLKKINKKVWSNPILRKKQSLTIKMLWKNKKYRKTVSESQSMHSKEMWRNRISALKIAKSLSIKPNRPEKKLLLIIRKNNFPFKYTGNYKFWIYGEKHSYNPDFIHLYEKKVIELFGEYWHRESKNKLKDKSRIQTYNKHGYNVLIIWE
ncbi:MAG: hypothetical protein QMD06_04560, partial [Candidatus Altarchaeum sp.]|nr:hypothetical protein [Candidatus Altarchaeum sp.]